MSHQDHNPSNLLTLPSELRLKIIALALLPPLDRCPNKTDFSPLLTCRQIYHECRHLPPQLYPAGLSYDASRPRLGQSIPTLRHPWQIANLRRLEIRWLYPSQLAAFLGIDETAQPTREPRFLLQEPSLRLDILKIYTDDWMTRARASTWRRTAGPKTVQYGMPGPACGWLVALCQLQGFKQLELVFPENLLEMEYWERGRFIDPLISNFTEAMEVGRAGDERAPEWTLWQKWTPDEDFGERLSVLRTRDLHLHRYPQWAKEDVEVLKWRSKCLRPGFAKGDVLVEGGAGRGGVFAESDPPSFHLGELLGDPKRRKRVCGHCNGLKSGA